MYTFWFCIAIVVSCMLLYANKVYLFKSKPQIKNTRIFNFFKYSYYLICFYVAGFIFLAFPLSITPITLLPNKDFIQKDNKITVFESKKRKTIYVITPVISIEQIEADKTIGGYVNLRYKNVKFNTEEKDSK